MVVEKVKDINKCIQEFEKFYTLLMQNAPDDYMPWFFPCKPNRKDPSPLAIINIDKESKGSWHHESARLSKDQCIEHIKAGNNIGISARKDDILIIGDIDDEKYFDQLPKNTLTVTSRKRQGWHFFGWNKDDSAKINLPTDSGEMRSDNQYVLAPGSFVPTENNNNPDAGYYTVKEAVLPRLLSFEDLPQFFKDKQMENIETETKIKQKEEFKGYTGGKYDDLFKLKVSDIVGLIPASKRVSHPLHESETAANFSLSKDGALGHCWRHMVSLNAVQYLCVEAGYSACEDAGTPHKGRGMSKIRGDKQSYEIAYRLAIEKGLIEEKEIQKEENNSETIKQNIVQMMIINKKKEAAERLANVFLKEHSVYTTRSDKNPEVWIYQDGIYVPEGITNIKEYVDGLLNENYTTYFINQVSEKIKIRSYINQEELFNETKPEYLIPVENGILNLKSGQIMDFDPKYKFFAKLPVIFDENAECPECKKFFNDVLTSKEDITLMQEIFGFSLLREYKYHHIFIFEGIGRNGKSVTLNLLKNFVGIDNCSEVSIDDLSNNEFSKSSLHKRLINISGDIGKSAITNSNILKSLSGGDLQEANRKFLEPIKFMNYAKLIFGLNELPISYDHSDAFYDRIILINYPMKFVDEKDMDEGNDSLKLRDPDIIKKISTQQELSGLLNWAIEGFKRLETQGFFSYNKSTNQIKKMYIRKSNSFEAYCDENLVFGEGRTEKDLIRKDYVSWCKQNKLGKPKGDKNVNGVMEYNGSYQDRIQVGSERTIFWVDVQRKVDIAEVEEIE